MQTDEKKLTTLFLRLQEIIQLANAYEVSIQLTARQSLDSMVAGQHQGVIAQCKVTKSKDLIELLDQFTEPPFLLLLDGVQDPHNVGACLRSANAFGVCAVIAPKDRAASLTDVAKKAACGAAEQTPFIAVTNLSRTIEQLQALDIWFVGLDADATLYLDEIDLKRNLGIVMGGEGGGLRRLTREKCDFLAKIPMLGTVESLNVSVATGIALYELQRHRK